MFCQSFLQFRIEWKTFSSRLERDFLTFAVFQEFFLPPNIGKSFPDFCPQIPQNKQLRQIHLEQKCFFG